MQKITIETIIKAGVDKVWEHWNKPESVMQWNQASADWHCPAATNDLRVGGKLIYTMSSKDGKYSFDFGGVYTKVETNKRIEFTMGDGRKVIDVFEDLGENKTKVTVIFEMEATNSEERQRSGWQAILNSFQQFCEAI